MTRLLASGRIRTALGDDIHHTIASHMQELVDQLQRKQRQHDTEESPSEIRNIRLDGRINTAQVQKFINGIRTKVFGNNT